jgi:hypothetical protein
MDEQFQIVSDYTVDFDVNVEGIGTVTKTFKTGELIFGRQDGENIRTLASHLANDKYYTRPVMIPVENVVKYVPQVNSLAISKGELKSILLLIGALTFAFLLSGRKSDDQA